MPPRHRPYRPKVKGCYECSQRRVSCDRGTPECTKCLSKGLRCSGLDLRYRFTKGVTIRGKWAGKSVQSLYERHKNLAEQRDARQWQMPQHRRTARRNLKNKPMTSDLSDNSTLLDVSTHQEFALESQEANNVQEFLNYPLPQKISNPTTLPRSDEDPDSSEAEFVPDSLDVFSFNPAHDVPTLSHSGKSYSSGGTDSFQKRLTRSSTCTNSTIRLLYEPLPDNLSCWERGLLSNYSDHIAKEMLAIDGPHNGWRYLVLPIAHRDQLVMNAVLTASSFHMFLRNDKRPSLDDGPFTQPNHTSPDHLYELTIQGLKQRDLAKCNYEEMQSIIATILVLLTAVMVNGRNDFPILFSLLDSATNVIGGEYQLAGNELGDFMLRQVRKMRVYAAPLISEQAGLNILSSASHWEGVFDCLRHCSKKQPNHAVAAAFIEDIVHQARDIYLRQALNEITCVGPDSFARESNFRLQRFKETIEAFPVRSPGKQVLIWATFIAASSSTQEEHKTFFESILMENFSRSKFVNLLKGVAQLRNIWARRADGVRWTHLLPQAQLFLM